MPHALLIDDDPTVLAAFAELIAHEGFETSTAGTLADARALISKENVIIDVILCDLFLPDGNGMDLLKEVQRSTQVILITGHASIDTAVEALRMGVSDYLTKPIDIARLKAVLANILRTQHLHAEIGNLRGELRKLGVFGPLIGASPAMQTVYDMISRVAPTDATVLLTGESGTGKELVAQALHDLSGRSQAPFLPLNCGAVSPSLIETELFGHERGSFTGADRLHKGYFERASGGTLFLDEITEMPFELQVKLLRVLETGVIMRIGGEKPVPVDVRVIAATNRRPEEAVAEGKLREDLLYRLRVFPLQLPPLRERGEDIERLAVHFLQLLNQEHGTKKSFTRATMQRFRAHNWPGNVRELKNLVHRAFILSDEEIEPTCLPSQVDVKASEEPSQMRLYFTVGIPLAEADRRLILATLDEYGGDKRKAAAVLGISLKTLYNRLNEYGFEEKSPCPV
ncbi:MAG: Fis family transcriptional regulator [Deltaproteobacteria bacterium]|nr:Fis family transcriptional regulator [Deltaproteobacteria bacterium]